MYLSSKIDLLEDAEFNILTVSSYKGQLHSLGTYDTLSEIGRKSVK